MRIAILSNINLGNIPKEVGKKHEVLTPEGYGNLFELMFNKNSEYHIFNPQITCIVVDICEIIKDIVDSEKVYGHIDEWFGYLEKAVLPGHTYFISDIDYRGCGLSVAAFGQNEVWKIESYWKQRLQILCEASGIFVFEYKKIVEYIGKQQFYSAKLWYLGKIPYSNVAQKLIGKQLLEMLGRYKMPTYKVLLLDLDNTLWGGVAGEEGIDGVKLSEDGPGGIYKDFQRVLHAIKDNGILLGIVSKNNEGDALEVIKKHPHMILKEDDFVVCKINWEQKHLNVLNIAKELNLGVDAFVFIDDNPTERELIKAFIPEVVVPEFPKALEELPRFALDIYETYFKPLILTKEDKNRTQQYKANEQRSKTQKVAARFEDFLEELEIEIACFKNDGAYADRVQQLLGKTNQFNLTTKRYTPQEVYDRVADEKTNVYSFKVKDRFGDYGIVGVAIVDKTREIPIIDSFLMSCRTMSKWIENYMLDYIEKDLLSEGYTTLIGCYEATEKNKPVQDFYSCNGYEIINENQHQINLKNRPKRQYIIKKGYDYER